MAPIMWGGAFARFCTRFAYLLFVGTPPRCCCYWLCGSEGGHPPPDLLQYRLPWAGGVVDPLLQQHVRRRREHLVILSDVSRICCL